MAKRHKASESSSRKPLVIAGIFGVVLLLLAGGYAALIIVGSAKRAAATPTTVNGQMEAVMEAGSQVSVFAQAAEALIGIGNQPMTMEQIVASGEGGTGIDPWGKPYRFHRDAATKRVWYSSDGPDMVQGTVDDIESAKVP